jgi:hypothetical protein
VFSLPDRRDNDFKSVHVHVNFGDLSAARSYKTRLSAIQAEIEAKALAPLSRLCVSARSALILRAARYAAEVVVIEVRFAYQPGRITVRNYLTNAVVAVRSGPCQRRHHSKRRNDWCRISHLLEQLSARVVCFKHVEFPYR